MNRPLESLWEPPSPLRERVGVRVEVTEFAPPHLASPPSWGEEFLDA